jgi:hypothetical protein
MANETSPRPLFDAQAEECTIGSLSIDPSKLDLVSATLEPQDFYLEKCRWIYDGMLTLRRDGRAIDYATLRSCLGNKWQEINGDVYLPHIEAITPTALHVETYAKTVKDFAVRRAAEVQAKELARAAYDLRSDITGATKGVRDNLAQVVMTRNSQLLTLLTADVILTTKWPDPVWAIPSLLPTGLTILAGKPKLGKSWLCLQIAQAIGSGGVALGVPVEKGPVLYLALEDTPRRLQDRMRMQNWPEGLPVEFMVIGQFGMQIGDLRRGGGERLARQIESRKYRAVLIDTLSRALYGEADQLDVTDMTHALCPVQEIALSQECAVMMTDHHNKGFGGISDLVGDILGSTAKGAVADCIWGLYRERGKSVARLAITGREVAERELALKMDWSLACWLCEGDANEVETTERQQEILNALGSLGQAGVVEIAKIVNQPKSNTFIRLQNLVNSGKVLKHEEGRNVLYELPGPKHV